MLINRIIYLLLLLASGIITYIIRSESVTLFLYFLLLLPFFCLLHIIYTSQILRLTQKISHHHAIKDQEDFSFLLSFANRLPLPMCHIKVDYQINQKTKKSKLMSVSFRLNPFSSHEVSIPVPVPYWGEYALGINTLKITDLCGLISIKIKKRNNLVYRVYPQIISLDHILLQKNEQSDVLETINKHHIGKTEYDSIRDYTYGDSSRSIHWKMWSKYNTLKVKTYTGEDACALNVFVDFDPYEDYPLPRPLQDQLIEILVGIGYSCLQKQITLRLVRPDGHFSTYSSPSAFNEFYDHVNLSQFRTDTYFSEKALENFVTVNDHFNSSLLILTVHPTTSLLNTIIDMTDNGYDIHPLIVTPHKRQQLNVLKKLEPLLDNVTFISDNTNTMKMAGDLIG